MSHPADSNEIFQKWAPLLRVLVASKKGTSNNYNRNINYEGRPESEFSF